MKTKKEQILEAIQSRSTQADYLSDKSEEFVQAYKEGHDYGWFEGLDEGIERGRRAVYEILNLYDERRIP